MHPDKGILKVGLEIEVCAWKNNTTYQDVARELVAHPNGYMQGPPEQWNEWHTYHCSCEPGGCRQVRRGDIIVPPLVSMTYDASLPSTGAEYIVSPILLADGSDGMVMLKEIWDIIVKDAEWTTNGKGVNGAVNVSPSIHIHVSANSNIEKNSPWAQGVSYSNDILHALELYSPELFALASLGRDDRRGLKFRIPNRLGIFHDEMGAHHGFIHVRAAIPNQIAYIEWRLFEAAYDSWEYLERAIYLSSVLTRSLLLKEGLGRLMSGGYDDMYDEIELFKASRADSLSGVLNLVSRNRLASLRELCLNQIDDDMYGFHLIDDMFAELEGGL
ncbi:hypothetical protein LCGC14_1382100 [marine sediment metagenome]|uniref:Uncharacterized protein n=1 Tax=marine sediment metagenome TaxID=412755 RepID=A0A0F9KN75_9ZZZZ